MMRFYILLLSFFCFKNIYCQDPQTIKVRKAQGLYFFQKGRQTDTVSKTQNNLFYLMVPDSLKKSISILVENGRLLTTKNDSVVELNYLQGLKYESVYSKANVTANEPANPSGRKKASPFAPNTDEKISYVLKSLINGTSGYPIDQIFIQIFNKKTGKVIIENRFYYKK